MIDIECPSCHGVFRRYKNDVGKRYNKNYWTCRECYLKEIHENGRPKDMSCYNKIVEMAKARKVKARG